MKKKSFRDQLFQNLVTCPEAQEILDLTEKTIIKYAKEGIIYRRRYKNKYYYDINELLLLKKILNLLGLDKTASTFTKEIIKAFTVFKDQK